MLSVRLFTVCPCFRPWQAPRVKSDKVLNFKVEVRGETFLSTEERRVMIKPYSPMTFIQTDKPIYKPGQTGNVRAGTPLVWLLRNGPMFCNGLLRGVDLFGPLTPFWHQQLSTTPPCSLCLFEAITVLQWSPVRLTSEGSIVWNASGNNCVEKNTIIAGKALPQSGPVLSVLTACIMRIVEGNGRHLKSLVVQECGADAVNPPGFTQDMYTGIRLGILNQYFWESLELRKLPEIMLLIFSLCLSCRWLFTVLFRVVTLDTHFSPVNQLVSWKYTFDYSILVQSLLFQSKMQKCHNTVMDNAVWYYVQQSTSQDMRLPFI